MLLAELGLSPLKVHWLRRSLNFWNELVSSPIGAFHRTLLFDNWVDATQFGVRNFSYSVCTTLQDLGCPLSVNPGVLPELDVQQAVTALQQSLLCAPLFSNPRTAPSVGIVPCTYHNWFVPLEGPSLFHWVPMSGVRMKRFLGFRLGSHKLPVAIGRRSGVARELRLCQHCVQGAVGDELHMVFECPHLQPLRDEFSHLFGPTTVDMRSFFSQQDKVGVIEFILHGLSLMT